MVICYIDNKKAYPNTSDKIKVTYENQFIKDSGSYTYEISFPMSVPENRELFNNINRFDVKKKSGSFENCSLMVDNRLIITGKGHITSVTTDAVKLQIAGGKSRIKYNSAFEKHFIDEIKYPRVVITKGINHEVYNELGMNEVVASDNLGSEMLAIDLTDYYFVGQPDVAAFNPINDETNERTANQILGLKYYKVNLQGHKYESSKGYPYMTNLAVQPFFMYVLRKVLESEGYKLTRNDFDCDPWNRLVIASARLGGKIKEALPHWSVYKFLDEVRKLFNASIVFDEQTKTVQVLSQNELISNQTVSYECDDEYSSEFDEDGLENVATSNLEYSFDDSGNRHFLDVIPLEVLRNYPVREFKSMEELQAAIGKMSAKEKSTTIFKEGKFYYIYIKKPEWLELSVSHVFVNCGMFSPLVRDIKNETSIKINIVPVALYQRKRWLDGEGRKWIMMLDRIPNKQIELPSISNDKEAGIDDMTKDEEDDSYYYTVEDAMKNGTDSSKKKEETDEKMVVMFQRKYVKNFSVRGGSLEYTDRGFHEETGNRYPYTDVKIIKRNNFGLQGIVYESPLSLFSLPHKSTNIDSNNRLCIKFYTDDIPDPSKIYNFRNKLFICEKVELEIDSQGIAKQKTGYFYEYV